MGKDIGRSFEYNRTKISTPTLKKPVLFPLAAQKSSESNLMLTFISSELDIEDITENKNKKDTSKTDDIQ